DRQLLGLANSGFPGGWARPAGIGARGLFSIARLTRGANSRRREVVRLPDVPQVDPNRVQCPAWWEYRKTVAVAPAPSAIAFVAPSIVLARQPSIAARTRTNGAGGGVGAVCEDQRIGEEGGRPSLRREICGCELEGRFPAGAPGPVPRPPDRAELKRGDVQDDQRSECDDQGPQRVHVPILAVAFCACNHDAA